MAEVRIDVKKLADVLYEIYCKNPMITIPRLMGFVSECTASLKSNIAEKKLNVFLKEFGRMFYFKKNVETQLMQSQLLISQFIKEALSNTELATLKLLIANAPRRVILPKMKDTILAEL
jgi:hypothetical protein